MTAEFRDGLTVGIDLGTTFSSTAQLDEDGNPVEAYAWYALADQRGHPIATENLKVLAEKLTASELADAKDRFAQIHTERDLESGGGSPADS